MSKHDPNELFDHDYYAHHCGPVPYERGRAAWQNHFSVAARSIVEQFAPRRTLDVGCAKGFLVEQLRDLGVEAYGIDVSEYAISQVREDVRPYCRIGSAAEPFGERYDLITCIEVVEHMPEDQAEQVIQNLCRHADEIVFSSTSADYAEPTHFNVQQPEYWRELFARNGFYPVLRDNPTYLTPQATRFRKIHERLRVAVFSREREEWAVVRLRVLDPLRALEEQGRMQVTFVSVYDDAVPIEKLLDADVWVIQREFADQELSHGIVDAARLLGKTIVFEIDDLLVNLPRSNPLWAYCTKIAPDMVDAVRHSDFVTASTYPLIEELAREEPTITEKAYVCRNVVDTRIWGDGFIDRQAQSGGPLVVGWFGSATHQEDLAIVKEAIVYLARKYEGRIRFHFWGYLPADLAGIDGVQLVRGPQANVVEHAAGVRSARIDVAIAPLTNHSFNRAKSDLKWLEYSICGIPGIYSRVDPYTDSIIHGQTGLIVDNDTASWVDAIELMIARPDLRAEIARNAFDTVRSTYCVDVAAMHWDDLYRSFVATGPRERRGVEGDAAAEQAAALLFAFQGRQQARLGRYEDAVESLESSLRLDKGRYDEVVSAAVKFSRVGRYAAGEKLLNAATRLAPERPEGHLWLARLHRGLGDVLRADTALRAAAKMHPADQDLGAEHVEHLRSTHQAARIGERLAGLVAAEHGPEEAVQIADMLVRAGRTCDALTVVRNAGERFPDVDFAPLRDALEVSMVTPRFDSPDDAKRPLTIAVYTRDRLSGARIQSRLAAPLRAMERAALTRTLWSDGTTRPDAIDEADVVLIHRRFADRSVAEPIVARASERGVPILFETDDLPYERMALDGDRKALALRDDYAWMLDVAHTVIVATERAGEVLAELAPGAGEKIVVVESSLDPEQWSSARPSASAVGRRLCVALVTDWAHPAEVKRVAGAITPLLTQYPGQVQLLTWSPFAEQSDLSRSPSVGCASPIYREYATRLQGHPIDLAVVPTSNDLYFATLSDSIWLELAACRIPGVFGARGPFQSSIIQGHTGIVVGDDPQVWADTIEQLLKCPDLRRDIAERAWSAVFTERTAPQQAASWFQLLSQVRQPQELALSSS